MHVSAESPRRTGVTGSPMTYPLHRPAFIGIVLGVSIGVCLNMTSIPYLFRYTWFSCTLGIYIMAHWTGVTGSIISHHTPPPSTPGKLSFDIIPCREADDMPCSTGPAWNSSFPTTSTPFIWIILISFHVQAHAKSRDHHVHMYGTRDQKPRVEVHPHVPSTARRRSSEREPTNLNRHPEEHRDQTPTSTANPYPSRPQPQEQLGPQLWIAASLSPQEPLGADRKPDSTRDLSRFFASPVTSTFPHALGAPSVVRHWPVPPGSAGFQWPADRVDRVFLSSPVE